ncbi:MAG: Chromosome [Candidatus Parcubacteria bacterium]|nr:Chromosome [Candidatus Parcubacteria bacterium]
MKRQPVLLSSVTDQICQIPIDKIRESLVTLRTEYDEEGLKELGESLVDQGQLQTIVVQPDDNGYYDLVIGSRRLRAAKLKKKKEIAGFIIEARRPVELLLIALAENLHRADLNPFEEAQGFLRLMKEFELSLGEIAEGVNKPESYIRSRLQLLSMPEEVMKMVSEKNLPINSVRILARLSSGKDQVRHARMAVKHHLSQQELSAQVQQELEEPARKERESYELTSVKLIARVRQFTQFMEKVPRRMKMHHLNATERRFATEALKKLEDKAKLLLEIISNNSAMSIPRSGDAEPEASNQGQEWTVKEIRRISSGTRPSDEILSAELGRTVQAIRSMRAKISEKVG